MSKTMLDNRIYNDSWFFSLPSQAKWLFLFLLTNESCNLIGCYEIPLSIICSYTGIDPSNIEPLFSSIKNKVTYKNGWVIIKNYSKYNPMKSPNIEIAKENQIKILPQEIRKIYDTLSIPLGNTIETLQGTERNGNGKETERKGTEGGYQRFLETKKKLLKKTKSK